MYVNVDWSRIQRNTESLELAGDVGVEPPYDVAERELEDGLAILRAMRLHAHSWDENGFCYSCGADGNA